MTARGRPRRNRGLVSAGLALLVLGIVGSAAAIWGPSLYHRQADKVSTQRCTATHGDYVDYKTAEQANNAAIIAAVGLSYGFDVQGMTVAIATAIQESSLRNLDYGDRDSLGLFQQRPSQGWGTEEQIMDPRYSSAKFYQALDRVPGWQDMRLTEAAQAVQRSGYPEAYEDHKQEALAWATALTGGDAVIDCDVAAGSGSALAFTDRIALDFGSGRYTVEVLDLREGTTILGVRAADGTASSELALREWVVATASTTGANEAGFAGEGWRNGEGRVTFAIADADPSPRAPEVIVRLSTG